jgi:hypothetical protein
VGVAVDSDLEELVVMGRPERVGGGPNIPANGFFQNIVVPTRVGVDRD